MTSELDKAAEAYAKTQPEWCMTTVAFRAGFLLAIKILDDYDFGRPVPDQHVATVQILERFAGIEEEPCNGN